MLKFANLTNAQKRYVEAALRVKPEIAQTGTVSRNDLLEIEQALVAERAAGGAKIGFPNWLTAKNKASRGTYVFPLPSGNLVNSTATAKVAAKASKPNQDKAEKEVAPDIIKGDNYAVDPDFDDDASDVESLRREFASLAD
jgi:hypothetical protein